MALQGTKVGRHGSDGGSVPGKNNKNMHVSMGKPVSGPDKTRKEGGATSYSAGNAHGSVKSGTGPNKMPKTVCHAQGPQKVG